MECQLDGLPTSDRDNIYIVVALDIGAESQPFTIRGDYRRVLYSRHRDNGSRLSAPYGNGIDIAIIAEIDLLSIGGKGWV